MNIITGKNPTNNRETKRFPLAPRALGARFVRLIATCIERHHARIIALRVYPRGRIDLHNRI